MATNKADIEVDINVDDGVRRDATHEQGMKHLHEAKRFIDRMKRTHETYKIPIQGGVIETTCPDKWEEHNKVYLRGNAIK